MLIHKVAAYESFNQIVEITQLATQCFKKKTTITRCVMLYQELFGTVYWLVTPTNESFLISDWFNIVQNSADCVHKHNSIEHFIIHDRPRFGTKPMPQPS